jgi:predicted aconitase with swiveling domain
VGLTAERDGATLRGRVLIPGEAAGPVLQLDEPLSFWGGVDPATSAVVDVRHPQHGVRLAGSILALPATRGSSSASSVMLELIHRGIAPAALIMGEVDAILLLGVLTAREMGFGSLPALQLAPEMLPLLPSEARIAADGTIGRDDQP